MKKTKGTIDVRSKEKKKKGSIIVRLSQSWQADQGIKKVVAAKDMLEAEMM